MAHPYLVELERIERAAWEDLARAAPAPFASAMGLEVRPIEGALLFMAARIPQFQFNWLAGAGLKGNDSTCVSEAVDCFRAAGQSKFIVQIPPGPHAPEVAEMAAKAGLKEHPIAWAKFHRETAGVERTETSLTIREIGVGERDVFAEAAIAGFGMPSQMATWLSQIVGRDHWHAYVSFEGDTPAGAGALYVDGEFAWIGIGATKPEMRNKGGQSALLAVRIADAAKYGAKHAVTETGVPQQGQSAPSYSNILKSGFSVIYVRPNWAPAS